eukprot:30953_1
MSTFFSLCCTFVSTIIVSHATLDIACAADNNCPSEFESDECLLFENNIDLSNLDLHTKDFFHLANDNCRSKWRKYSFDIIPLDWRTYWIEINGTKHSICYHNNTVGYIHFDGEASGLCTIHDEIIYGDFEGLLVWKEVNKGITDFKYDLFKSLVTQYITATDERIFQEIVGSTITQLVEALATDFDDNILTNHRFIKSKHNAQGFHLLRALLAERIMDARQSELKQHPLYDSWHQNGFLLMDYNALLEEDNNDTIASFFEILSPGSRLNVKTGFVKRPVKHRQDDKQYQLHQDTFHQVVKMWIYDSNTTKENGPLMIVPHSNRYGPKKLRWLFDRTKDNAPDVVEEPSIRFVYNLNDYGFEEAIHVLPKYERTLVIADTSAFHCRGKAEPGTMRIAYRPSGVENDGGLGRVNPYEVAS